MLDDNLPVYFFNKSQDGIKHFTSILNSYQGSEPALAYTLKHADPNSIISRNCYAAALFDAYNSDVLFGEILLRPQWTQSTPSQDELRRNNGVPPPPIPKNPTEFVVQLYNPDQQVKFTIKTGSWGGTPTYEFSMPQTSFRAPSASSLDRSQSDPAAYLTTPRYSFVWRRDSKLSKDYTAYMTGRPTDPASRKKGKDPDVALALFRSMRELTIYESNLARLDMEDAKGLEIVFLLSAATIKDVFAANNVREAFNIGEDSPTIAHASPLTPVGGPPPSSLSSAKTPTSAISPNGAASKRASVLPPKMPDARAQWELDAETARLAAIAEKERRDFERLEAKKRQKKEKEDEAETKRLLKMVQDEERAARARQKAIDTETERLRLKYGNQPSLRLPARPQPQQRPQQSPSPHSGKSPSPQNNRWTTILPPRPASSQGSHSRPHRASSGAYMMTPALLSPPGMSHALQPSSGNVKKKKSSIWSMLTEDGSGRQYSSRSFGGGVDDRRISRKASAMW